MILIGDENIAYEKIVKISTISDISTTPAHATVLFNFDIEILKHTQTNEINSAVIVNNIKEIIYASNLDARYIIVSQDIQQKAQKIADNYMFDSKILTVIKNDTEIENIAFNEIDGAIYQHIIND